MGLPHTAYVVIYNFNDYYENKPCALIFDIIVSDFNILKQCKSQTVFRYLHLEQPGFSKNVKLFVILSPSCKSSHWRFYEERCSWKFRSIQRSTHVLEFHFNVSLQACNFIKKTLQRRYFPVNITKFLTTPILENICKRLLLVLASIFVLYLKKH